MNLLPSTVTRVPFSQRILFAIIATIALIVIIRYLVISPWLNTEQLNRNNLITMNPGIAPLNLRLVRTLSAPNEVDVFQMFQSGTSRLTWSPDGAKLAVYARYGLAIEIWNADGTFDQEIRRYNESGLGSSYILAFVKGHSQLIMGPSSLDLAGITRLDRVAYSILDLRSGVLRNVDGPRPGRLAGENIADLLEVSQNERMVAAAYHGVSFDTSVGIFSADTWARERVLFQKGSTYVVGLAFSGDNTLLAIGLSDGRVRLVDTHSWADVRTIDAFSDGPPGQYRGAVSLSFSADREMIAVGCSRGGSFWEDSNGQVLPKGRGKLTPNSPPDPLRVFRVRDGTSVASAYGFQGGFSGTGHRIAWAPKGNIIAFLSDDGDLNLWSPTELRQQQIVVPLGRTASGLAFSPDGSQLAVNIASGIRIYALTFGK